MKKIFSPICIFVLFTDSIYADNTQPIKEPSMQTQELLNPDLEATQALKQLEEQESKKCGNGTCSLECDDNLRAAEDEDEDYDDDNDDDYDDYDFDDEEDDWDEDEDFEDND